MNWAWIDQGYKQKLRTKKSRIPLFTNTYILLKRFPRLLMKRSDANIDMISRKYWHNSMMPWCKDVMMPWHYCRKYVFKEIDVIQDYKAMARISLKRSHDVNLEIVLTVLKIKCTCIPSHWRAAAREGCSLWGTLSWRGIYTRRRHSPAARG